MALAHLIQLATDVTPLACWLVAFLCNCRGRWRTIPFAASVVIGYVLILVWVPVYEDALRERMDDPTLSPDERAEAGNDLTADTGRLFAGVTGLPISLVWTSLNFVVLWVVEAILRLAYWGLHRWLDPKSTRPPPDVEKPWTASPETGNPYQSPATERSPTAPM